MPGLGNNGGLASWVGYSIGGITGSNAIGDPLGIGSNYVCDPLHGCTYSVVYSFVPPGMTGYTMNYRAGNYSSFLSDVQTYISQDQVIFSLDLEPVFDSYGFSSVKTTQVGGFDYRIEAVPLSEVSSTVAADGAQSRIATAISYDDASGLVDVISYGWTGDSTSAYESKTMVVNQTGRPLDPCQSGHGCNHACQ